MRHDKVIKILIDLVSNDILCKLTKYKDANDIWGKLVKLYGSPSPAQDENNPEKEDSLT